MKKLPTTLRRCRAEGRAILAVNVFDFESLRALAEVFGAAGIPVIAQFSARFFASHAPEVPVAWRAAIGSGHPWLHLDHCGDPALITACAAAGFDSVMFDGSALPLAENTARSRRVARMAKRARPEVLVECEIGHVSGVEDGAGSAGRGAGVPRLDQVLAFHAGVGADLLAVGFGNMHGHYRGDESFDLELMRQVALALPRVPLVLHGGSGMKVPLVRRLVGWGHCKVNISTDLKVAWMASLGRAARAGSPLEAGARIRRDLLDFFRRLQRKYSSIFPS